jgi:hypothetical protein
MAAACAAAREPAPDRAPAPPARADSDRKGVVSARARLFDGAMAAEGPATVRAALEVLADPPLWGGLSGLALAADGADFVVASDRGALFAGRLLRRGGALAGMTDLSAAPLTGLDAAPRPPRRDDMEALARGPDGSLTAGFEQDHRVWRWPAGGVAAEALPRHPGWDALPRNAGLEALAATRDGALIAIAEQPAAPGGFPLYRLEAGAAAWTEGVWPGDPAFRPTGADVGPDGRLYVLERSFLPLAGFRMRLRRATLRGADVRDVETLITLRGSGVDNFEAIGVWRDETGALLAIVVSDDNFMPFQRTLIVEIALPP